MRLIIKTKNFILTDAIGDYCEKKIKNLEKFLEGFNQDSIMAEAELSRTTRHHKSGDVFRFEVNLTINGKLLRSESEQESIYAAIDDVYDELAREIKGKKTRQDVLFRRIARSVKKKLNLSPLARLKKG
ncbi:MAG: ribosome-associated translation inhibitor RaiA [Candidatus Portnoybacteria bacterium]|nr:ribosome-associated translation inhibitor RaiA [Candidatus Portnoybacteria bacterium]